MIKDIILFLCHLQPKIHGNLRRVIKIFHGLIGSGKLTFEVRSRKRKGFELLDFIRKQVSM